MLGAVHLLLKCASSRASVQQKANQLRLILEKSQDPNAAPDHICALQMPYNHPSAACGPSPLKLLSPLAAHLSYHK
jgi:hypothetical protein